MAENPYQTPQSGGKPTSASARSPLATLIWVNGSLCVVVILGWAAAATWAAAESARTAAQLGRRYATYDEEFTAGPVSTWQILLFVFVSANLAAFGMHYLINRNRVQPKPNDS